MFRSATGKSMGNRPERAEFQSLILRATGRLWEIGSALPVASELCFRNVLGRCMKTLMRWVRVVTGGSVQRLCPDMDLKDNNQKKL